MFTVTLSLEDRGYTREVWTCSCDMEVGGSVLDRLNVERINVCAHMLSKHC